MQWQRFENSGTHQIWDTQQHFPKTHFCLESGFLLFLELQKSLLVSFQGCWTQWQWFESSSIHHFWDTPTAFSQNTCFSYRKCLSFIPRAPEIPTRKISWGFWTQWQRLESSSICHIWDTPQHFLKTHFCLESGFLLFLELQKSLLVSFQECWMQRQRFESSSIHHFWDTQQHLSQSTFLLR